VHGSFADLPDDVVVKLDDNFNDADLSSALVRLRSDGDLRQTLAVQGLSYVNHAHHPERIAELYYNNIEDFYTRSPRGGEEQLVRAIAHLQTSASPTNGDLAAIAAALAANRERFGAPQILVDVTKLAKSKIPGDLERARLEILMQLITDPPPGYRVEPVRATTGGYLYARRFTCRCLGLLEDCLIDSPVETNYGDVFLGLDSCLDQVPLLKPWFSAQHRRGTRIVFVAYDLPPPAQPALNWISAVAEAADGFVCVSQVVADGLHEWLSQGDQERAQPLLLGIFELEANIPPSQATAGASENSLPHMAKTDSRQLLDVVLGKRWYRSWPDEATTASTETVVHCPESSVSTTPRFIESVSASRRI
jgi:hypothetical protein